MPAVFHGKTVDGAQEAREAETGKSVNSNRPQVLPPDSRCDARHDIRGGEHVIQVDWDVGTDEGVIQRGDAAVDISEQPIVYQPIASVVAPTDGAKTLDLKERAKYILECLYPALEAIQRRSAPTGPSACPRTSNP